MKVKYDGHKLICEDDIRWICNQSTTFITVDKGGSCVRGIKSTGEWVRYNGKEDEEIELEASEYDHVIHVWYRDLENES